MSIELEAEVRHQERVWITAYGEVMLECDNIDVVVYYSVDKQETLSTEDSAHMVTKFPYLQRELEREILKKAIEEREKCGRL